MSKRAVAVPKLVVGVTPPTPSVTSIISRFIPAREFYAGVTAGVLTFNKVLHDNSVESDNYSFDDSWQVESLPGALIARHSILESGDVPISADLYFTTIGDSPGSLNGVVRLGQIATPAYGIWEPPSNVRPFSHAFTNVSVTSLQLLIRADLTPLAYTATSEAFTTIEVDIFVNSSPNILLFHGLNLRFRRSAVVI